MKIMIVDDEVVSRMKMQKILNSFGDCEAFENGAEAVKAFRESLENYVPFDIITLDVNMPAMDGSEVLFMIRGIENEMKVPKGKRVKILMVTSQADKDTIITCLQAGCDDYVAKPFDKGLILEKFIKMKLVTTEDIITKINQSEI